jgi:hypothetical protein
VVQNHGDLPHVLAAFPVFKILEERFLVILLYTLPVTMARCSTVQKMYR